MEACGAGNGEGVLRNKKQAFHSKTGISGLLLLVCCYSL